MLARQAAAAAGSRGEEGLARAVRWAEARAYAVPFICAISDTSPTSKLNVTFLHTCAIEPQTRRPQPRTTDSGVQLPQRRYLRDVGGKRPGETILAKQPAGPPSVPSAGGTETDREWDNVQIGDGRHRGNKGREPARQRISRDVSATRPRCERRAAVQWGTLGRAWACARARFAYYAAATTGSDSRWC